MFRHSIWIYLLIGQAINFYCHKMGNNCWYAFVNTPYSLNLFQFVNIFFTWQVWNLKIMNYLNSLFRDEKTRDIFDTSLFQRWLYTLMDFFHFHVCSPFFSHNHSLPLSSSYSFVRERGERQIVGTLTVNLSLSVPLEISHACKHALPAFAFCMELLWHRNPSIWASVSNLASHLLGNNNFNVRLECQKWLRLAPNFTISFVAFWSYSSIQKTFL